MSSGSATLQIAARSRAAAVSRVGWRTLLPLLLPCALLLVGTASGFGFSLNRQVAGERLIGLLIATALAVACAAFLMRSRDEHGATVALAAAAVLALLGGLWVIAATGPEVFRGGVGSMLQALFRPVFGLAEVTDPIEIANTRFVVGYNGLADLALVAIFCTGAVVLERPRSGAARALAVLAIVSLALLIATGARGGLIGLGAGICAIGLYAWPRRRLGLLLFLLVPLAVAAAAFSVLDKGLEFSSTAGRLIYWRDIARLLSEFPLTGVGLGLDTAYQVTTLQYEINPDPERIFYAHNTFVQTYLETGPLGTLGMLAVPLVALAAAVVARRHGVAPPRRSLLIGGLGVVGALSAHGLTDQVVTTNVGTAIVLIALASAVAALSASAQSRLAHLVQNAAMGTAGILAVILVFALLTPTGRAQLLLNVGSVQLNQALALETQDASRTSGLAAAEGTLALAMSQDPSHPGVLRQLARARASRFDDSGAMSALQQAAAASPRLDAFDKLQIAHLYRDLGSADEAYAWAARAYDDWSRAPEDSVMQVYAQSTLVDPRAKNLAEQAEAAMRWRMFGEARSLFEQALTFERTSVYLQDRLGAADRAVQKYGP